MSFKDLFTKRIIKKNLKKLKSQQGEPVSMYSFGVKKKVGYDKVIGKIGKFLSKSKTLKNKDIYLTLQYDNIINFDTFSQFESFSKLKHISQISRDFFTRYNTKSRIKNRVTGFSIFVKNQEPTSGGTSDMNLCLYNIVKNHISATTWDKPSAFKRFCGVGLKDKVPVSIIPKLEKKLKTRINIFSDVIKESTQTFKDVVNISIINGHYIFIEPKNASKFLRGTKTKHERKLITFCFDNSEIISYNGIEISKLETIPKSYEYISIKCDNQEELKEEWETKTAEYNELKENFRLNPYNFPDIKSLSLHIFYECYRNIEIEPIEALEGLWLKKGMGGGLRYADKGTYENTEIYDVNSLYPYILGHKQIKIPIGKPAFTKLEELPGNIQTGLYKAKIDNTRQKIFYSNFNNIYSNYDLNRARELNLNIELIQDEGNNAMIYPKNDYVLSSRLKKSITELYKLKKNGVKLAKSALNLIWGAVCSYDRTSLFTYCKDEIIVSSRDKVIPSNDYENFEVVKQNPNKMFKSDFARLGCFLTSRARSFMSNMMEPYEDNILFAHTDSFLTNKPLTLSTGLNIGELKLENSGKCNIISKNEKEYLENI